ncbi:hypothetical protein AAMO2058_000063300 [Amorphochlora amoebiformis]
MSTAKPAELETKELMEALWPRIFAAFDSNGDGKVDRKELESKMKEAGNIGKAMAHADCNSDKVVTKAEWDNMLKVMFTKFGAPTVETVKWTKGVLEKLESKGK